MSVADIGNEPGKDVSLIERVEDAFRFRDAKSGQHIFGVDVPPVYVGWISKIRPSLQSS
jgi:hypothetical protein